MKWKIRICWLPRAFVKLTEKGTGIFFVGKGGIFVSIGIMPRIARGLLGEGLFHVLNRGNHRQMLFRRDEEFAGFLDLLGCSVAKFSVKLWGYCLMGNHWGIGIFRPHRRPIT